MNLTDFLFLLLCLGLKLAIPLYALLRGKLKASLILTGLAFFHTYFCYYYYSYSLSGPADSNYYYYIAEMGEATFGIGTRFSEFVAQLVFFLAAESKMAMFFIYSVFGFWGLSLFFFSMSHASRFAPLLIFLPGLSFWSVAIGKEPLIMFSLGLLSRVIELFDYSLKSFLWLLLVMVMVICVRPHVALIIAAALGLAFLKKAKIKPSYFFLVFTFAVSILAVTPMVLENLGLQEASFDAFSEKVDERQSVYTGTGMGMDLSSASWYYIYFSYMFRPLPMEASGLTGLMVSIENLILLFLFLFLFFNVRRLVVKKMSLTFVFSLLFFFIGWMSLALVTGNLGIAVRQKMMLVPFLLIVFSWLWADRRWKEKE